jgi:hypothetical protein
VLLGHVVERRRVQADLVERLDNGEEDLLLAVEVV